MGSLDQKAAEVWRERYPEDAQLSNEDIFNVYAGTYEFVEAKFMAWLKPVFASVSTNPPRDSDRL